MFHYFFFKNVLLVALHNNPFTLHTNKEVKFSTHLFDFLKSDLYIFAFSKTIGNRFQFDAVPINNFLSNLYILKFICP